MCVRVCAWDMHGKSINLYTIGEGLMIKLSISFSFQIGGNGTTSRPTTLESWGRLRNLVKKRDLSQCQYCGEFTDDGELDHVIPLSRGGTDAIDNLVWACKQCNRSKHNRMPDDFVSETTLNRSIENPKMLSIKVIECNEIGESKHTQLIDLPKGISQATFLEFCQEIVNGDGLAQGRWTGAGNLFSRAQFDSLMQRLERAGLVDWRDPTAPARGRVLTGKGMEIMTEIVRQPHTETEKGGMQC